MPQLSPMQVQAGQAGTPEIYGKGQQTDNVPFQDRVAKLFKPTEYVEIKNIDDEPLYWQYMPTDNEQIDFTEDGTQTIVTRKDPEMWMIPAGKTEPIIGASAYRALDTLYKQMAAKKVLSRFADPAKGEFDATGTHVPRNFNFSDGGAQERFLKEAYVGKANPFSSSARDDEVALIENTPLKDTESAKK